ncbi:Sodium/hydrogen exchanger family [Musa troglodytarum]|uniref:Sodium/hydrogen exchanger family n=1 Tax=Musa troglodytarum TaxID=320322 RepID=A0A9E7L7G8_9LILI|nr:Sodium/hydrogen exchanger family [Musa troglodytarum]
MVSFDSVNSGFTIVDRVLGHPAEKSKQLEVRFQFSARFVMIGGCIKSSELCPYPCLCGCAASRRNPSATILRAWLLRKACKVGSLGSAGKCSIWDLHAHKEA